MVQIKWSNLYFLNIVEGFMAINFSTFELFYPVLSSKMFSTCQGFD